MPMTIPKPASMATVSHRLRNTVSIESWNSSPSTTIGTEPMITSQPIRASGLSRGTVPRSEPTQLRMISQMSRRKYRITAASVPSWVIAVNADPTSSPPKNCPTIDWWALEEIGRNSVSPCTTPSTRASSHPIRPALLV